MILIKVRHWKILTYYRSQQDLEETLALATTKGIQQNGLFELSGKKNLSFGSEKVQDYYEWALDGLLEKEDD
ncbi:16146_t:CDS:2 [Rhizophagus irregularis]|nr:16146_t:CDS:2 [Rhizophagus irregularis]